MKVKKTTIIRTPQEFKKWISPYIRILDEGLDKAECGNCAAKKVRSKNKATPKASLRNKFEADFFDKETVVGIHDVDSLYTELKEKMFSMNLYCYKKNIEKPMNGVIKRARAGALDIISEDGNTFNILKKPDENLFRIFVKDKENKALRCYLIEDSNKLISNYHLNNITRFPQVPIYAKKDMLDKTSGKLTSDLSIVKNILNKAKEIIQNLEVSSKK